jgi:hypothetical protein
MALGTGGGKLKSFQPFFLPTPRALCPIPFWRGFLAVISKRKWKRVWPLFCLGKWFVFLVF